MSFSNTLLTWYDEHARTLPWRGEEDPYKIWVSEIILQQTRVQQGWDYYLRFIETFPDVRALAEAPEEQVLRVWQGLGYYSRARNMHAAARQIVREQGGQFPRTYEEIRKLKGVGDYTAAAIASIAYALPHPAVDGNVLRIISRLFGIVEDISKNDTRKRITEICQKNIDPEKPGIFNQACMDFGSLVCTPKNPKCGTCPFRRDCYAAAHNLTETLPVKSSKTVKRDRYFHFTCSIYNNCIVIEKRTGNDIWRNLYQFPLTETDSELSPTGRAADTKLREILSHQIIHAAFYIRKLRKRPEIADGQRLVNIQELADYPMPKIMVEFLKQQNIFS